MATIDITNAQLALLEEKYPGLLSYLLNTGVQPTAPAELRSQLVAQATALSPGVTTDLPGTLVEDMASTAVGALTQIDQAKVDLVNSVSPLNANPALLDEFGEIYGVRRGAGANPSAYVTFTGAAGFYIGAGFQVSDGIYIYETQDSDTIPSGGVLENVYVLATTTGTTLIPANSITTVTTGVQPGVSLTVTNPQKGTPGTGPEDDTAYRARILERGNSAVQGAPSFIRSRLLDVPNVVPRSVGVTVTPGGGYGIMVDGGDPHQIAGAIYDSCFDLPRLEGSVNGIAGATLASPCQITTEYTHGLTDGQQVTISGAAGTTAINGTFTVSVVDARRFTIPVDTTTASPYGGSGVLATNPRNMSANVIDGGDTYPIAFIRPLQQKVRMVVHWQAARGDVIDDRTATLACGPQIADYINGLTIGSPLSTLEMGVIVEAALLQILPGSLISSLSFEVYFDDIRATPQENSVIIPGDAQSYLVTSADQISLTRG